MQRDHAEAATQAFEQANRALVRRQKTYAQDLPERAGAVVKQVVRVLGLSRADPRAVVAEAWEKVLPEVLREETRVTRMHNGVATVETENAAWKAETEMFHKSALVESLRAHLPPGLPLRDIRIRISRCGSPPELG